MLNPIIVMTERRSRIVRRVDENTFDLTGELLFECFEGEEVVTEDETVIEKVVISHAVRRVIGLFRVFEQDTRLKPGPVLLPDPGEFEFGFVTHREDPTGFFLNAT